MSIDIVDLMIAVIIATLALVVAIILVARAIDRRRDRVRLSPDWHDQRSHYPDDDEATLGDRPFISANEARARDEQAFRMMTDGWTR